jgi:hypothetical protein
MQLSSAGLFLASIGLEQLDRLSGHHGRDRMFVNELGMGISAQQHAKIIEPSNVPLQLNPVNQEYRDRHLCFADMIEKHILQILALL